MKGQGYEGKLVWAIVTDDAREADRKAEEDAQRQRAESVSEFTEGRIRRADIFPTPAGRALWQFTGFRALDPDSIQTSFASKYRARLTGEEITSTIRGTLSRWVNRITQDLSAISSGTRPNWLTLAGGHHEAAASLSKALEDHPDLKRPLYAAIAERWPPEPEPERPTPQAQPRRSGPSGGFSF